MSKNGKVFQVIAAIACLFFSGIALADGPEIYFLPITQTYIPGTPLSCSVMVRNVANLNAFQFTVFSSGQEAGTMDLTDMASGDIFAGQDFFPAKNVSKGLYSEMLLDPDASVNVGSGGSALGNLFYIPSPDASGSFNLGINPAQSYLIDNEGNELIFAVSDGAITEVPEPSVLSFLILGFFGWLSVYNKSGKKF